MTFIRVTPKSQGVSSPVLLKFVNALDRQMHEMHSLMLLRHGAVVAEGWWQPYAPPRPHMLFSLTKSFTSTAVGLAVSEGLLSVEDTLLSFFPDQAPARPSKNLKALRLKHLLSMVTGHAADTTERMVTSGVDWIEGFLKLKIENPPGAPFVITATRPICWRRHPAGHRHEAERVLAAAPVRAAGHRRDRLGELAAGGGDRWVGAFPAHGGNRPLWAALPSKRDLERRQLIRLRGSSKPPASKSPMGLMRRAIGRKGYGYQFWRCRYNAYHGDGAFGQFCVVLPEQDAVLAMTAGVQEMQPVLDLVWKHLLPAFSDGALPETPRRTRSCSASWKNWHCPRLDAAASRRWKHRWRK